MRWRPAVDVNRFLLGMQLVAAAALLVWRAKLLRAPRPLPRWARRLLP